MPAEELFRKISTPNNSRMMPKLVPNRLATKICKILDGGYCDVRTLARLCNESTRTIEWLTKPGARIDRDTEFRIGKVLAAFSRKCPELNWDIEPPEKRRTIVEIETHNQAERTYEVYDSTGKWRGTWTCPAEEAETGVEGLSRFLEARDKAPLQVMRGGDRLSLPAPESQPSRVS